MSDSAGKKNRKAVMIRWALLLGGMMIIVIYAYLVPESLMPGDLSEAHESEGCMDCHEGWSGPSDTKCRDCHEDIEFAWHNETSDRKDCTSCHWEHRDEVTFEHFSTGCASCHTSNHTVEEYFETCEICHSHPSWDSQRIDHESFPDTCDTCHEDAHPEQGLMENDCLDCHDHPDVERVRHSHDLSAVQKLTRKDDHEKGDPTCFTCHDEERFDEYNCIGSGCHGSRDENNKHREEGADDWKERHCFESDCHAKDDDDDDDDDEEDDD